MNHAVTNPAQNVGLRGAVDLAWLPLPNDQRLLLQRLADNALLSQSAGSKAVPAAELAAWWNVDASDLRGVISGVVADLSAHEETERVPGLEPHFEPKTRQELLPFLELFPYVLGLPFPAPVSGRLLLALRALPVHILGITGAPAWADGQWCSPLEYFFHDLDHARFKIREDLLVLGYDCPDAYQSCAGLPASTLDPRLGQHRGILREVQASIGEFGPELWALAPARLGLARRLLDALASLAAADKTLAQAAELLLLEIVHEKSFPMDSAVIARELRKDAHLLKLRHKCASGFYGVHGPGAGVIGRLSQARAWWHDSADSF